MTKQSASTEDHRKRVGAARRGHMRRRLIESSMLVFAEKGGDASVIDDVIATAEVARGTFYYHFRSSDELLQATSEELVDELLTCIEQVVGNYEDPGRRIAIGLRLYFHAARKYPLFAKFVSRTGFSVPSANSRFYDYLPRHIAEGIESGCFKRIPIEVLLDLMSGFSLLALSRLATTQGVADYPEQVVGVILRGMGMKERQIDKLLAMSFEPLVAPEDSLIERSHHRYMQLAQ